MYKMETTKSFYQKNIRLKKFFKKYLQKSHIRFISIFCDNLNKDNHNEPKSKSIYVLIIKT
jgi:hypothetical protein